jgi:hypothetical protein
VSDKPRKRELGRRTPFSSQALRAIATEHIDEISKSLKEAAAAMEKANANSIRVEFWGMARLAIGKLRRFAKSAEAAAESCIDADIAQDLETLRKSMTPEDDHADSGLFYKRGTGRRCFSNRGS